MRQLPQLVSSLPKTVTSANKLVVPVDNGYDDNTRFNRDLSRLLLQANDTLTSIGALADLLSPDPTGRSGVATTEARNDRI